MSNDSTDSRFTFAGAGSLAVLGGVVCCLGLKLVGGAALFGGLAALVGLSTDQTTFLVGLVGTLPAAAYYVRRRGTGEANNG